MTIRRPPVGRPIGHGGGRTVLLIAGLMGALVLVAGSPVLMASLAGTALPWGRLADVGDTFGGASALLSAVALCGIGASLIFQQRQVHQELANMDRQQHVELLRLAIDNPELIEVLGGEPAGPNSRHEIYANLAMMYWLAIWELGEVDDDELRAMVAGMFGSEITRQWWSRVGAIWIGTRRRPARQRFLAIISDELAAAETAAGRRAATRRPRRPPSPLLVGSLAVAGLGWGIRHWRRRQGRRSRPVRMSSMNRPQDSRL